jgi:hypothetical protein
MTTLVLTVRAVDPISAQLQVQKLLSNLEHPTDRLCGTLVVRKLSQRQIRPVIANIGTGARPSATRWSARDRTEAGSGGNWSSQRQGHPKRRCKGPE